MGTSQYATDRTVGQRAGDASRASVVARLVRVSVPTADTCALAAAAMIVGIALWNFAYAAIVLLGLHVDPARAARISPRLSADAGWLLARATVPLVVLLPAAAWLGANAGWAQLAPLSVALLLLGRGVAYAVARRARAVGTIAEPTLIVGAGEVAEQLAEVMAQHPEYGLRLVGSVDAAGRRVGNQPMLGDPGDLAAVI